MSLGEARTAASRRRLGLFYLVIFGAVALAAVVSLSAGDGREPQPSIAGGYAVERPSECLTPSFDLVQSGQFVNLENDEESVSGRLRFEDGRLTGTVECAEGGGAELDAEVADETISGALGAEQFVARFEREPAEPGARQPVTPESIDGEYALVPESECLGGALEIEGDDELTLSVDGTERGTATYSGPLLEGSVRCADGADARISGTAADRKIELEVGAEDGPEGDQAAAGAERLVATKQREFGATVAAFFVAVVIVMIVARICGALAVRLAQPRVMGEVVAGIVLGPTVFGALAPQLQSLAFPTDIIPLIGVVANLGLIFYMFLVGLELDGSQLKGRISQALAISNASVALPMALGLLVALPVYELVAPDDTKFVAFALFIGVAMSITAFPVLARILVERRMLKRPLGAIAMAAAAVDDVSAWFLIALASAVAVAGSGGEVAATVALAAGFCLAMFFGARPLLARLSETYDEAGRVPTGWIAAIFAGVLVSAYATETIGIALIFGAFVMGLVMPRHAELTEDVTGRIEDFVVVLLLPLFFAYTGLRTNIGLLDRPELWLLTAVLIAVAIVGKFAGAMAAARLVGFPWRASGVIGTLMNTRGLTELIVLNLALEKGVIPEALFAALVIMALVTTFMAGPILRLLDPRNEFGAPLEDEFREARQESETAFPALAQPSESILVGARDGPGLAQLRSIAEPLARSEPARELILTLLVRPPRAAAAGVRPALQTENALLEQASELVQRQRDELAERGVAARAVSFISADASADLLRVAGHESVALLLISGHRPLLGEGVPRGEIGSVLERAPGDVAVLVAREQDVISFGEGRAVVVPFGGAEHDWAALELGAWISASTGAPLRLLGAAGEAEEATRVSRMLADAGLLVQSYAGVRPEPVVIAPGRQGVLEAGADAALMVLGLSSRWRREGLGSTRAEIARVAPAPILFVRRGDRPGALAPSREYTEFAWSVAGKASAADS